MATEKPDSLAAAVSQFSKHLQHTRQPLGQVLAHPTPGTVMLGGPDFSCRLWSNLQPSSQQQGLLRVVGTADTGHFGDQRSCENVLYLSFLWFKYGN